MRIPVTLLLDDLERLLTASPGLIARYEENDPGFVEEMLLWLKNAEQILARYSLPQVADISAARGRLLAARDGILEKSYVLLTGNVQIRRKIQRAVSALVFNHAQELLASLQGSMAERRTEALRYIRQMVMLMEQQGVLPSSDGASRPQALARLFVSMSSNSGSTAAARHVLTLVNNADALRLLDEILTEWNLQP